MTDQPEALILAEKLEEAAGDYSQFDRYLGHESAAMLREQHAEIQRLRDEIERLRAEVLAEREACAKIVDANAAACVNNSMLRDVLRGNAAAIRARGE